MSIMEIKGYLVVKGSKKTTGIWNIQTVEYEVESGKILRA